VIWGGPALVIGGPEISGWSKLLMRRKIVARVDWDGSTKKMARALWLAPVNRPFSSQQFLTYEGVLRPELLSQPDAVQVAHELQSLGEEQAGRELQSRGEEQAECELQPPDEERA
jgi:hypothetical protein